MMRFGKPSLALFCGIAATGLVSPAAAQFPSGQPITFVVGFAAGGASDIVGRMLADRVGSRLGVNVLVENRPGAGGNLANRMVATANADGHTVLVTTTSVAVNETLYKNKGYSAHDLRAVSIAALTPESLIVNADNPAKTLPEFVANAKGKNITFGTAGVGTSSYIAAEYFFKVLAKAEAVHVPFQGGAPALNALMGNHVDSVGITLPTAVPHIQQGRLRGLAVANPKRVSVVPDTPTYDEGGYPGFHAFTWVGVFVPAKTSDEVAGKLNSVLNEVLKEPEIQQKLKTIGFDPNIAPLADSNARFKDEIETWGKMVNTLGLSVN